MDVFSLRFWAACFLSSSYVVVLRLDFPGQHSVTPSVSWKGLLLAEVISYTGNCLLVPWSLSANQRLGDTSSYVCCSTAGLLGFLESSIRPWLPFCDHLCASLAISPFSSTLTSHPPELWGRHRQGSPASHAPAPATSVLTTTVGPIPFIGGDAVSWVG